MGARYIFFLITQLCSKERSSRAIRFVFKLLTDLHWYDTIGWFSNNGNVSWRRSAQIKQLACQRLSANCALEVTFSPFRALSRRQLTFPFDCLIRSLLCYVSWSKMSTLIIHESEEWSSQWIFQFKQLERRSLKKKITQRLKKKTKKMQRRKLTSENVEHKNNNELWNYLRI